MSSTEVEIECDTLQDDGFEEQYVTKEDNNSEAMILLFLLFFLPRSFLYNFTLSTLFFLFS